jgi:microcystin-dependent protein
MKFFLAIITVCFFNVVSGQTVGIGIPTPVETVEVNGNMKTNGVTLTYSGSPYDFLTKIAASGIVGYKKGHGGLGMNYIICVNGLYPTSRTEVSYNGLMGEIRIFTGDFAPSGWMLCHGQHLRDTVPNTALYALLGKTFGGTDSTFALPDLRGLVPVGLGAHPGGLSWSRGQKSY